MVPPRNGLHLVPVVASVGDSRGQGGDGDHLNSGGVQDRSEPERPTTCGLRTLSGPASSSEDSG